MLTYLRNLWGELTARLRRRPARVNLPIPYRSQFASPELVEVIITRERETASDPRWAETGAETAEDYALWAWQICGMTCVSMVLEHRTGQVLPVVALAKEAARDFAVYRITPRDISPMYYAPAARFIKERLGFPVEVAKVLTPTRVKAELARGRAVIVSVHPDIRDRTKPEPGVKGGHLVLVTGYDETNGQVFVHNPSGFARLESQAHYPLSEQEFAKFFAGRGLIIF